MVPGRVPPPDRANLARSGLLTGLRSSLRHLGTITPMKYPIQILSLLSVSILAACAGTGAYESSSVQDPAQATTPINQNCPVSGKAVDGSVYFDYDGKVVAVCCKKCIRAFEADPAKYAGNLGDQ